MAVILCSFWFCSGTDVPSWGLYPKHNFFDGGPTTGDVGLLCGTTLLFSAYTAPGKVGSCCVVSNGYNSWKRSVGD